MAKPILCLDFDGVIHSYTSGWKAADVILDKPVLGSFSALRDYAEHFTVCIHSSRFNSLQESRQTGENVRDVIIRNMQAVCDWMVRYGWPEDRIAIYADGGPFDNLVGCDGLDGVIRLVHTKPPAFLTIDDRAITFAGTFPNAEWLLAFRPWNKPARS